MDVSEDIKGVDYMQVVDAGGQRRIKVGNGAALNDLLLLARPMTRLPADGLECASESFFLTNTLQISFIGGLPFQQSG